MRSQGLGLRPDQYPLNDAAIASPGWHPEVKRPAKLSRPTYTEYQKAKAEVALDYAPEIYPCRKCGWPVLSGYCCTYCEDTDPSEKEG